MSPTQRSLKLLRSEGWTAATVEKWNPHCKIRQDLWGFGDLLAFRGDQVLIVQTTSGSNVTARIAKMRLIPAVDHWLESASRRIVVHGWRRLIVGRRKLWSCRTIEVTPTGTLEL